MVASYSYSAELTNCQCNISTLDPKTKSTVKMERYLSNELRPSNRSFRDALEHSRFVHGLLKVLAVFGVSLIIADGVLTPAQSILGSIQGIEVVSSTLTYHTVVGISCAILVTLFVVQPLGITKISGAWAPVVIIWLMFNFCFGVYVRLRCRYYQGTWLNINRILQGTTGPCSKHFRHISPACGSSAMALGLETAWRHSTGFHWCRSTLRGFGRLFPSVRRYISILPNALTDNSLVPFRSRGSV